MEDLRTTLRRLATRGDLVSEYAPVVCANFLCATKGTLSAAAVDEISTAVISTVSRSAMFKWSVNPVENAYTTSSSISCWVIGASACRSHRAVTKYHQFTPISPPGEGIELGAALGSAEGTPEGALLGREVGCSIGCAVGWLVGCAKGCRVGTEVGWLLGSLLGALEGWVVGKLDGCVDGTLLGKLLGGALGG